MLYLYHNSRRTWSQTTSRSDTNRQQYSKGNNEPIDQRKTKQGFWHAILLVACRPHQARAIQSWLAPRKNFYIRLLHKTSPRFTPPTLEINMFICKRTKSKHNARVCWNPQTSERPEKHGTSACYIELVQTVSPVKRPARYLNAIQQAQPERLKLKDHYTS